MALGIRWAFADGNSRNRYSLRRTRVNSVAVKAGVADGSSRAALGLRPKVLTILHRAIKFGYQLVPIQAG
jgi:hypothetical protein